MRRIFKQTCIEYLRHYAVLCVVVTMLVGCSLTDAIDPGKGNSKKNSKTNPSTDPDPLPLQPEPVRLSAPLLARRIAVDLSLRLPSKTDIETIIADAEQVPTVITSHITGAASSTALAKLHPRMWHLSDRYIPALDSYIERGDSGLASSLTSALRRQIIEEPAQMVRYTLDHERPFSTLFTNDFSIMQTDASTFWDTSTDGAPWYGEPFRFALYTDDRPAAGILASNALLASQPAFSRSTNARAVSILENITCKSLADPDVHLFYDLSSAELASDLNAFALTKPRCLSCHAQMTSITNSLTGLGVGANFSAFKAFTTPSSSPQGYYSGQAFSGLQELAELMGDDPRVHRCEIEKLIANLYQRPFSDRDRRVAALALDEFYAHNMSIKAAAQRIVTDPEYYIAPIASKIKGRVLYTASGVRVLTRAGWQGILDDLIPGATTIEYPPELDPGSEETVTDQWMVPSATYWLAIDRLARQAATALIAEELADDAIAINRRLLQDLPDGAGHSAKTITIYAQIRAVWQTITGDKLDESSKVATDLQTLWQAVDPKGDKDAFRRAWRTVLIAILTHPEVVTY